MLINIVTAWWRSQKGRPRWSHDWAHRIWALESWHTRAHQHSWCSLCSLALIFFVWQFERQDVGLVSYEACIAGGIDTQTLLLYLTCSITPANFMSVVRGTASGKMRYSRVVSSNACFVITLLKKNLILQSAGKWEEESDKSKVDHSRFNVLFCAVLLCSVCSHMCLLSFAAWENSTTLVWELIYVQSIRAIERTYRNICCMHGDLSCWLLREFPVKLLQTSPVQQDSWRGCKTVRNIISGEIARTAKR